MSDDPISILSQDDIDALLKAGGGFDNALVIRSNGKRIGSDESVRVIPYDFNDPVYLDDRTLARLREKIEDFIKTLCSRLAAFLKLDVVLKLGDIRTTPYQVVVESLNFPTFISIFRLEPLSGVGLLNFPPRLAMAMVDRMLGGPGVPPTESRLLTPIETVLLEDIIDLILNEWVNPWSDLASLSPVRIGSDTVGHFLQTAPPKSIMIVVSLEVMILDCTEIIQIGLPYSLFEPVLYKMEAAAKRFAEEVAASTVRSFNRELCDHLSIPLSVDWNLLKLSVGDLLSLKSGDILELPVDVLSKARVLLGGKPRFLGELGVEKGHIAVELKEVLG
jgi:flagellar motor switch protein FliM